MKSALFCLFFVCPFFLSSKVHASQHNHTLHHKLHNWKLLHHDDVTVVKKRHKRSLDIEEEEEEYDTFDKEIIFESFGKKFHLSLFPNYDIFHQDFKAKFHGKNGKIEHVHFDQSELMTGKVIDEPDSFVNIHFNSETQMMLAHIHLPHDIYFVEPVWRHIPTYGDQHMVVYRYSDLKDNHFNHIHKKSHFCDTKQNKKEKVRKMEKNWERKEVHVLKRKKREVVEEMQKKICTVTLVADQRFYKHMARENRIEAMSYLVTHMTSVDKLYLKTNWDPDGKEDISGYRLQIAGIVIHEERNNYTYTHGKNGEEVGASDQLYRFASYPHDTCLAHLFTYIDFERGLLGLAYVAEVSASSTEHGIGGGICAKPQRQNPQSYNTGLTSMKNWGKTILSVEAYLVTAHEIGHNFGATHDESNSTYDCVPGQDRKGNYIMYPAAVPGTHDNNFEFSICSKQSVKRIIETRADWCFLKTNKNVARCGNFWKEPGEECDGGHGQQDVCCDKKCKLVANATCSPQNDRCCSENCQPSPTTKLCANSIPGLCIGDSYCDGVNHTCPPPLHLEDGTECGDKGKCKNGTCQSFCATEGLRACLCPNKPDQCSRCCVHPNATDDGLESSCRVYKNKDGEVLKLGDNSMCAIGYCSKGVCVKHTQDVITRVLDLISEIAPDKIGKLLADNIVGGVLVFSLIFWIPFSCFINFVDKKRLKHQEEEDARYFSQLDCYQRSIATSGIITHSRYQPIAEHDPRAPPDGNSITDDEDDSGALSCATNPSSKGYFPQAKLNHTQITWSSDDDGVTSAEQQPIACDDETSRERLLESQQQQQRPPFMRAQALIITSPTSPSPPDIMYMEPLHEEQEIVTSQRPSLHRQEATELL